MTLQLQCCTAWGCLTWCAGPWRAHPGSMARGPHRGEDQTPHGGQLVTGARALGSWSELLKAASGWRHERCYATYSWLQDASGWLGDVRSAPYLEPFHATRGLEVYIIIPWPLTIEMHCVTKWSIPHHPWDWNSYIYIYTYLPYPTYDPNLRVYTQTDDVCTVYAYIDPFSTTPNVGK